MISSASMISGLAGSIQNREYDSRYSNLFFRFRCLISLLIAAVQEMQEDLPATSSQFSWSISAFILLQGLVPLVWSAISEIKGRKVSISQRMRCLPYLIRVTNWVSVCRFPGVVYRRVRRSGCQPQHRVVSVMSLNLSTKFHKYSS